MSGSRHQRDCRICSHPDRERIEADFVAWRSPMDISKAYSINRSSLYLHVNATGLSARRDKNIRGALSRFIKRGLTLRPTPSSFVAACQVLSRMNAEGETVDRIAIESGNDDFTGFTRGELERFASDGTLPEWYAGPLRRTPNGSTEEQS